MTTEENYEKEGFFKTKILVIGLQNEMEIETLIRVCEDDNYADVIINDEWHLAEWIEDEEIYAVFD